MLLAKSYMDYQETLNAWKMDSHLMRMFNDEEVSCSSLSRLLPQIASTSLTLVASFHLLLLSGSGASLRLQTPPQPGNCCPDFCRRDRTKLTVLFTMQSLSWTSSTIRVTILKLCNLARERTFGSLPGSARARICVDVIPNLAGESSLAINVACHIILGRSATCLL